MEPITETLSVRQGYSLYQSISANHTLTLSNLSSIINYQHIYARYEKTGEPGGHQQGHRDHMQDLDLLSKSCHQNGRFGVYNTTITAIQFL